MDRGTEKWYRFMRNAGGILLALGVAVFSVFSTTQLLEVEQEKRIGQVKSVSAQVSQIEPLAGQAVEENEKKSLEERLQCWWTGIWTIREPRQDELTMEEAYTRFLEEKSLLMSKVEEFPWDWEGTTLLGAELTSAYREDLGSCARWRMYIAKDPKPDGEDTVEVHLDAKTGKILYLEMLESAPYSQDETDIQALIEAFGAYWGLKDLVNQANYKSEGQETCEWQEKTGPFGLIATVHIDRQTKERMQMIYINAGEQATEEWTQ